MPEAITDIIIIVGAAIPVAALLYALATAVLGIVGRLTGRRLRPWR